MPEGVGGGCGIGDLGAVGSVRMFGGMSGIGGGRLALYNGSRTCCGVLSTLAGEPVPALDVRVGKLAGTRRDSSLLWTTSSGKGDVSLDGGFELCLVSGDKGRVLSCSLAFQATPGSEAGNEILG